MTFRRIAGLTCWLAATQLIATSVHAADPPGPDKPDAPPATPTPPPPPATATPWTAPPAVLEAAPAVAPRPPAAGPLVHLNSNAAELELQLHTQDGWDTACVAPCDQRVSRAGLYRVNGPGIRPSQPFNVPSNGNLRLDVTPGSGPRYWTGMGLTLGGLGTVAYGLLIYSAASSTSSCSSQDSFCEANNGLRDVGTGFAVVGGIVALIGAFLWAGNSTEVQMR
jgi:hypothetical protein